MQRRKLGSIWGFMLLLCAFFLLSFSTDVKATESKSATNNFEGNSHNEEFICNGNYEVESSLLDNVKQLNGDSSVLRKSRKNVLGSGIMPSIGNIHSVTFMIEFSDTAFAEGFTEDTLSKMMYGEENPSSSQYQVESVNAWYQRSSYGKFSIYGDVRRITLNHPKEYYTYDAEINPNGKNLYWNEIWTKIKELNIDWSEYDINGDKYIDSICFVIAGQAEGKESQWRNQMLSGSTIPIDNEYRVGNFTECMENQLSGCQMMIHEIGHCLGLSDLYNTTDMMSNSYGDFNGLYKMLLGWIDESQIKKIKSASNLTTVSLGSYAQTGNCAVLFLNPNEDSLFGEYYLIQYQDYTNNNAKIDTAKWGDEIEKNLQIYHINAELDESGNNLLYNNDGGTYCKLIEAVDHDLEYDHGSISSTDLPVGAWFYGTTFEKYHCNFFPGDELTPYSAPSSGKYATDRKADSPDVFSGLNIKNIQINDTDASFTVSYDATPDDRGDFGFCSMNEIKNIDSNIKYITLLANHDFWIQNTEIIPYLRKKGSLEKINCISVSTKERRNPTGTSYSPFYGHNVLCVEILSSLEENTEYEIVFPKGMFVTSYGEITDEIVFSGLKTQINLWTNDSISVDMKQQGVDNVLNISYEYILNESGTLLFAGVTDDGSINLYELDMDTGKLLSTISLLEGSTSLSGGAVDSFGQCENGAYWVGTYECSGENGNRWIYLFDSNYKLISRIEDPTVNGSFYCYETGNNYIRLTGWTSDTRARILDVQNGELLSFASNNNGRNLADTVFVCGENFLVGEAVGEKWDYSLRDKKDNIVKKINLKDINIFYIDAQQDGYLLFGAWDGKLQTIYTDTDFKIKASKVLMQGKGSSARIKKMPRGYLIKYNGQFAIFDEKLNLYTYTTIPWGDMAYDNVRHIQLEGKSHFMTSSTFFNSAYSKINYQVSKTIEIPNKSDFLDGLDVSTDIVIKVDGYLDLKECQDLDEYIKSIQAVGKETYQIITLGQDYYLKVENAEETAAKYYPILSHTHTYGTDWKSNAIIHWKECSCGEKKENAVHTEDAGTVTKEPTETETGQRTYKCSVCGYVTRTEDIAMLPPPHTHAYGTDWKSDTTTHWKECSCGEKKENAVHTEDAGTITREPTETETGQRTYKCAVCGYVMRTEEIEKHGEGFFEKENETTTEVEAPPEAADIPEDDRITSITINPAFNMKHKDGSNVELELPEITIKAKEIYDEEGLKRAEAALGETLDGNKHYNLLDLTLLYDGKDFSNGYDGLVKVIIPLPKGHRDKTFSCYRLTDGKKEVIPGEQTEDSYIIYLEHFSEYALVAAGPDEPHAHVYSTDWKSDAIGHWKECACKDKVEESVHMQDAGTVTKEATKTETGIKTYKCSVCGYVIKTEEIAKLPAGEEIKNKETSVATKVTKEQKKKNEIIINKKVSFKMTGNSLAVAWNKLPGADGYDIYAASCDDDFRGITASVGKNKTSATIHKIYGGKINGKKAYKVKVEAYRLLSNGKKQYIGTSVVMHVTGSLNKTTTNAKNISLKKKAYALKKGKSAQIRATIIKADRKKKLLSKTHGPKLSYVSSDEAIATVTATGKIEAKKRGKCTIYVRALNGIGKEINVTVN